jgi:hypothetical protein
VCLFKYSTQRCKRNTLNDFDDGVQFKCTINKPNVFSAWAQATPAGYGHPSRWKYNIPDVPKPEQAEDEVLLEEFVFHDA